MIFIMRTSKTNARAAAKDATHERIVAVAARAIRRSGYEGTGVADIMKEAGLTHGAFYSHFTSREAMLAAYLSREHVEQMETGCPLAALGSETSRQAPEVRRIVTRHIKAMIDLVARESPDWGQHGAHERALVTLSTMVGALLLARAVDEPVLSDSLREAALKQLTSAGR